CRDVFLEEQPISHKGRFPTNASAFALGLGSRTPCCSNIARAIAQKSRGFNRRSIKIEKRLTRSFRDMSGLPLSATGHLGIGVKTKRSPTQSQHAASYRSHAEIRPQPFRPGGGAWLF